MEVFYAVCAGIVTAAFVIIAVSMLSTLSQVKKTASEVEKLTKNANNHMEITKDLLITYSEIGQSAATVWFKALKYAIATFTGVNLIKKRFKGEK